MSQHKSKRIAKRPRKTNITPIRLPKVPVSYEEAKALYNTPDYRAWREEVLKRDGYLCQMCGKSGQMEVHHIKRRKDRPELTMVPSNGITLCVYCHQQVVTGREPRFEFIFSRIVKANERINGFRYQDRDIPNKEQPKRQGLRGELLPYSEAMDQAQERS